ncbi:AEC family transporter [Streptomyces sp. NBS 14/10]|uniref:AEC family transporter n=1 Tax=Streptomyces sp. NBS 14/10 TaxID=1945643 RepID=UPI000B7D95AC|nr:AEC family transporter [Streptomyces sp. NBS 14/10]KAK1184784.1 AEC family transporter [Streptomyces sp. NBS 14/10]NUS88707.1 AEC family transporter [Streptomyces sp.]
MGGVISGFGVIASIVVTGYVLGRRGSLGEHGRDVLTAVAFQVASPALLFSTLSRANLSVLLSVPMLVTGLSTVVVAGTFIAVGAVRRWSVGRTTIGALCASYVNAGNLGIPVAMYVLGDASLIAPVLLFQQLVVSPIALTVIDLSRSEGRTSLLRQLTTPVRNPIVVGSLSGVVVAAAGWRIPGPVMEPVSMLGAMAVPGVLLAFGLSLPGSALPGRGEDRGPVLLSVALKSFAQPVVAWAIAAGVFGLGGAALFAAVVTSALPSAQNLFTYAVRYQTATRLARESILLSTLLAAPVLLTVAALLG